MNALYIMIPMAMAIAGFALVVFLYALKSGQFEDIEAPKYRMLFDEEDSHPIKQNKDN
ncbi:MAG: cbb3-type cytochrome oxidase assembly protein CcoS [Leptospiraceae bacterium]|nr:cbb3-type cytochrome oxidase assembly protein CcoS [Leptospiraceae bacterium]MCP5494794.1 cbb3-type cytochrome oxidase assembly protein CcoS [Leptospiraceae bacterium]